MDPILFFFIVRCLCWCLGVYVSWVHWTRLFHGLPGFWKFVIAESLGGILFGATNSADIFFGDGFEGGHFPMERNEGEGTSGTNPVLPWRYSSPVPSISSQGSEWIEECYGNQGEASSSRPNLAPPQAHPVTNEAQPHGAPDLPEPHGDQDLMDEVSNSPPIQEEDMAMKEKRK